MCAPQWRHRRDRIELQTGYCKFEGYLKTVEQQLEEEARMKGDAEGRKWMAVLGVGRLGE